MKKHIDILNLEWSSSPGRDRIAATLVCNYLRLCGYVVEEQSVFDGYHALNKLQPRLLLMTNTTGAPENISMMKYAKSRCILGASLISEGNFTRSAENHLEMIWGWNKDRKLLEDLHLQWSKRTLNITLDLHPELNGRIKVSGGVGFDNYRIQKNSFDREIFLNSRGLSKYKKIIGIGCFDFGNFYSADPRYALNEKFLSPKEIERFQNDGRAFDTILTTVANLNKDILFIARQHPGALFGHKSSATIHSEKIPNVIVVKDELSLYDSISMSDFWMIYESTTALEAWLLNKQTCLLNPSGRNFSREVYISEGSPAYTSADELNKAIKLFFMKNELPGFKERSLHRSEAIKNTIQWDDGLNHVRAGNIILDLIESNKEHAALRSETMNERIKRVKQHLKWVTSPWLSKIKRHDNSWSNKKNFSTKELENLSRVKFQEQLDFYKSRGLTLDQLRQIQSL